MRADRILCGLLLSLGMLTLTACQRASESDPVAPKADSVRADDAKKVDGKSFADKGIQADSPNEPVETTAEVERDLASSGASGPKKNPKASRLTGVRVSPDSARSTVPRARDLNAWSLHGKFKSSADSEEDDGLGMGPGRSGDKYSSINENPFRQVGDHPLSTFSIDVDTASYANTRRYLMQNRRLPPAGAVRIEELVNYFSYDYKPPTGDTPFATHVEIATCPWQPDHRLMRVGLKGKVIGKKTRPPSNLVFLLDVSGSMSSRDKLPLLQQAMFKLIDGLGENDRVAIVVYAGNAGLVLPSTSGMDKEKIRQALGALRAGGSTAGGAGITLAYQTALDNFIQGGTNRVLLCTDGDFNVGVSSTATLTEMVEAKAKSGIFLSVLGFGRGNLNDAMMEKISNRGNGNYAYIDNDREATKVLVEQMQGTLVTIAKDVKIQIEFNPAEVAAYRLIGYENRMLKKEDFNNDKKDAGEIGAGHTVTALYEVIPATGQEIPETKKSAATDPSVDELEFQKPRQLSEKASSGQLVTLKLRYKEPDGDKSRLLKFPIQDEGKSFAKSSEDFQFSAAVAAFGMLLRDSKHRGDLTLGAVEEIAHANQGKDQHGYRAEFLKLVDQAKSLHRASKQLGAR